MLRRRGWVEPVAELETLVPKIFLTRQGGNVVHPGAHTFELVGENASIPESLIQHPRDNGRGIRPGSRSSTVADYIGNDMRHGTTQLVLFDRQILEPGLQQA